jgi:hypothetical protein
MVSHFLSLSLSLSHGYSELCWTGKWALAISEKALGLFHSNLAAALNDLAGCSVPRAATARLNRW